MSTSAQRWWVILVLLVLTLTCGNGFVNSPPLPLAGRTLVPYGGVRRVTGSGRGHGTRLSMLHIPSMGEVDHGTLFAQLMGCGGLLVAGSKIEQEKTLLEGNKNEFLPENREVDVFRDTAVRYLGYANECGEAFRPLVPEFAVIMSYVVAVAYVTADAVSKGYKCSCENEETNGGKINTCVLPASLDVLTFQLMASVIIPGFTINRWVTFITYLRDEVMHLQGHVPDDVYTYLPTAAGLALIPFIVKPLDALVEDVLEKTLQPVLIKAFPHCDLKRFFKKVEDLPKTP